MAIVANKSLALLCFLLAVATSQAEAAACTDVCIKSFAASPSATARDVVAGCTAKCALVENQRKTIDALLVSKTEDYNRTEAAAVEEVEKLTEEMISINNQLKKVNCPSTTAQSCYDKCRMDRQDCARLCGCTVEGTEAATVEEEGKKLTRQLISLINQLKKVNCPSTTAQNCYDKCRMDPQDCARQCGCTLEGTEVAIVEEEGEKLTRELISLIDRLKKVNCPSTTARNCYDRCRMTPQECARRCSCTLEETEEAMVKDEGEKLTRELISLIDQLKKVNCPSTTAQNCYDRCRMAPQECARRCGCTLTGKRCLTAKI